MNFNKLTLNKRLSLEVPFSEEEVKEVVWSGARDKSSWTDGFKGNVFGFVSEFHLNSKVSKVVTTSILVVPQN